VCAYFSRLVLECNFGKGASECWHRCAAAEGRRENKKEAAFTVYPVSSAYVISQNREVFREFATGIP
jgi:hypothetical protein